jgi:hypothetical protein
MNKYSGFTSQYKEFHVFGTGLIDNITVTQFFDAMKAEHAVRGAVVLDASKDLVTVVDHVKPMICVKG